MAEADPRKLSVLSIAGSDPSGCSGIQADLRTLATLGVQGASVITALTAQNTVGAHEIHVLAPSVVHAQLEAVTADLRVGAVKVGMLGSPQTVRWVASYARAAALPTPPNPPQSLERFLVEAAVWGLK